MKKLLAAAVIGLSFAPVGVIAQERAEEAFRAMWEGRTHGKTVFTR